MNRLLPGLLVTLVGCGLSHGADGTDGGPAGGDRDGARAELRIDAGPHDLRGETWEGYVEATMFASGSDAVRIVFDSAPPGDGPRTGVVIFGAGEHPPAATDPDVGYPPGAFDPFGLPPPSLYEGFVYPITSASVEGQRVRVSTSLGAVWSDWCPLQTSYPSDPSRPEDSGYACLPNLGFSTGPDGCSLGDGTPVDCHKLDLCMAGSNVCECTATGCVAAPYPEASFDFHVVGDNGDGTTILAGEDANVHLVRR